MIINDPNGDPVKVTTDRRMQTVSVIQTDINALAGIGKAWTLPFKVTAADTTDNVLFHFNNTSSEPFDFMRLLVSSTIGGLWTIETGRTHSAGGTAMSLVHLKTGSGVTQDMTAYYGNDVTLAGTATDIYYLKSGANEPYDVLQYGPLTGEFSSIFSVLPTGHLLCNTQFDFESVTNPLREWNMKIQVMVQGDAATSNYAFVSCLFLLRC